MAINNLRNTHLSQEQVTKVKEILTNLQTALADVNVNLSANDRKKYGRINEQNKLLVNRVNDFHLNQAKLQSPQVDWTEFDKDFESRKNLSSFIDTLESLLQNLKNARILHDYDNYQDALTDYGYTNYMAGSSAVGFEAKQKELAQFFARTGKILEDKPETSAPKS